MDLAFNVNENVVEWIRNETKAYVTFSQGSMVTKIKKLAEKFPDECKIISENNGEAIYASIPRKWVKITPPRQVEMTDERREELSERFRQMRANRQ